MPDDIHSTAATGAVPFRRAPARARGRERVERLLDAAAELIAEVGLEGATTNAIAARARTSVGSLYQFFPNRDAIVAALAARYLEAFARLKDDVFSLALAERPLPELIRGIVTPLSRFSDAHPAYRQVYPVASEAAMRVAIVGRVAEMLAHRWPWLPRDRRHAVATVQVETVHAVLFHAQERPKRERASLREELVRMLVAALEPFDAANPHAGPAPGRAQPPTGRRRSTTRRP